MYIRAKPVTIENPKDAQVLTRLKFAEIAKKAKGKKGLAPDGLPWAAHYVKEGMKGFRTPEEVKYKRKAKWEERLETLATLFKIVREAIRVKA